MKKLVIASEPKPLRTGDNIVLWSKIVPGQHSRVTVEQVYSPTSVLTSKGQAEWDFADKKWMNIHGHGASVAESTLDAKTIFHIMEFIKARHRKDVSTAKKEQDWLKKKLGNQYVPTLMKHGDPDFKGYNEVMQKWLDEETAAHEDALGFKFGAVEANGELTKQWDDSKTTAQGFNHEKPVSQSRTDQPEKEPVLENDREDLSVEAPAPMVKADKWPGDTIVDQNNEAAVKPSKKKFDLWPNMKKADSDSFIEDPSDSDKCANCGKDTAAHMPPDFGCPDKKTAADYGEESSSSPSFTEHADRLFQKLPVTDYKCQGTGMGYRCDFKYNRIPAYTEHDALGHIYEYHFPKTIGFNFGDKILDWFGKSGRIKKAETSQDAFRNMVDEVGEDLGLSSQEILENLTKIVKTLAYSKGFSQKQIKEAIVKVPVSGIQTMFEDLQKNKAKVDEFIQKYEAEQRNKQLDKLMRDVAKMLLQLR